MNTYDSCFYHSNRIANVTCDYCHRPICLEDMREDEIVGYSQNLFTSSMKSTYKTNSCLICKRAKLEVDYLIYSYKSTDVFEKSKAKKDHEIRIIREEADSLINELFYKNSTLVVCAYHTTVNSLVTCNLCHLPICDQDKRVVKFLSLSKKKMRTLEVDLNTPYCILCKKLVLERVLEFIDNEEKLYNKSDLLNELYSDLEYVKTEINKLYETMSYSFPVNKELAEKNMNNQEKEYIHCKYHNSLATLKCAKCNAPLCERHYRTKTDYQVKQRSVSPYENEILKKTIYSNICLDCYIEENEKNLKRAYIVMIYAVVAGTIFFIIPGIIAFVMFTKQIKKGRNDIDIAKGDLRIAKTMDQIT